MGPGWSTNLCCRDILAKIIEPHNGPPLNHDMARCYIFWLVYGRYNPHFLGYRFLIYLPWAKLKCERALVSCWAKVFVFLIYGIYANSLHLITDTMTMFESECLIMSDCPNNLTIFDPDSISRQILDILFTTFFSKRCWKSKCPVHKVQQQPRTRSQ